MVDTDGPDEAELARGCLLAIRLKLGELMGSGALTSEDAEFVAGHAAEIERAVLDLSRFKRSMTAKAQGLSNNLVSSADQDRGRPYG